MVTTRAEVDNGWLMYRKFVITPIIPPILDDIGRMSKYHANLPPCFGTTFHEKKAKNMISQYKPTILSKKFLKVSIFYPSKYFITKHYNLDI